MDVPVTSTDYLGNQYEMWPEWPEMPDDPAELAKVLERLETPITAAVQPTPEATEASTVERPALAKETGI